jgi:hypothetical protein
MASKGWLKRFDDPIVLDDGSTLHTLQQAVAYLAKTVPKADQNNEKVQAAATMLTYAAERESAWMFMARAATLQVIHRNKERVFDPSRKDTHWGRRKLKRDR